MRPTILPKHCGKVSIILFVLLGWIHINHITSILFIDSSKSLNVENAMISVVPSLIFFIQSSSETSLKPRSMCGILSAIKLNPSSAVILLSNTLSTSVFETTASVFDSINSIQNSNKEAICTNFNVRLIDI